MTQPSEQTHAGPGQSVQPGVALRSAGDSPFPSRSSPNIKPAASPLSARLFDLNLSHSEPGLSDPPTASTSSIPRSHSTVRTQSHDRSSVSSPADLPNDGYRQIILNSFAPRVAVFASPDTEEFLRLKGFEDGLYGLLRPYGEILPGKVIIRDSIGSSRSWDDFSIRFVDSKALLNSTIPTTSSIPTDPIDGEQVNGFQQGLQRRKGYERTSAVETFLGQCLQLQGASPGVEYFDGERPSLETTDRALPLYPEYLRKFLSSIPIGPHETFAHPVTCLIAVSSHNPAPIEALRQLYAGTGHGKNRMPAWIGTEYLRYYVLVHDEEKDDIAKSSALFDLMKRHFGLHCHLLRLRSSQCIPTDDDSVQVPPSEWHTAEEEILEMRTRDYTDDFGSTERFVFESDFTAIRALLRELVTQSIVPFMENRVTTWNDQVASRRRGLSGRFMSLSKRWTGFGSTKGTSSPLGGQGTSSSSNYNVQNGFYPPETPEAVMRQLGDYAFMLRDWKLAYSTYDAVRTDFAHNKAWKYHAGANEMAAITSLINPHTPNSKQRSDGIDQMLDTAAYSYLTRCATPSGAIRCLTLALELLQTRGPIAADDAARWGAKLLELNVLRPIEQTLTAERIADCYASRAASALPCDNTRRRQAALWNILASYSWIRLDQPVHARRRLHAGSLLYGLTESEKESLPFPSMHSLWAGLEAVDNPDDTSAHINPNFEAHNGEQSSMMVESEQLDASTRPINEYLMDGNVIPHSMSHIRTQSINNEKMNVDSDGFE